MERTLSTLRDDASPAPSAVPVLYLALHGYAPLTPPSRHVLDGIEEVVLGRGESLEIGRRSNRLEIQIPDPWMSSSQARIKPVLHRWVVEDLGSRNGTLVGGDRVSTATLADGDLIEVGHTCLVFRQAVELADDAHDVNASAFDSQPAGIATLVPTLAAQFRTLARIAPTLEPVLVLGETGTGKELICRAIHHLSGRTGDLVAVNCGGLPETLVEGALFGHARGAFSGAVADRRGFFRAADRGTLFLDEIGDLRFTSQAALLRTLQEKQVVPLGSESPIDVDVRVCSATHRPLDAMLESDEFREDLLARLRGFCLELPPLRQRREDLGLLARAILRTEYGDHRAPSFSSTAARALFLHDWPQNIRELARAIGAALALAGDDAIGPEHLPDAVVAALTRAASAERPQLSDEDAARRGELVALLKTHQGNIAAVARELGKARQQIHRWLKRYDIDVDNYRA